jgi:hypothetical protein
MFTGEQSRPQTRAYWEQADDSFTLSGKIRSESSTRHEVPVSAPQPGQRGYPSTICAQALETGCGEPKPPTRTSSEGNSTCTRGLAGHFDAASAVGSTWGGCGRHGRSHRWADCGALRLCADRPGCDGRTWFSRHHCWRLCRIDCRYDLGSGPPNLSEPSLTLHFSSDLAETAQQCWTRQNCFRPRGGGDAQRPS